MYRSYSPGGRAVPSASAMKKLGIVAIVAVVMSSLAVWYMAVLPLRSEIEASEELIDSLRGKLEVSQAEASSLKEENFVLTRSVTSLEEQLRTAEDQLHSVQEREDIEQRYWQERYNGAVDELRKDARDHIRTMEMTESNFLRAVGDLEECESSLADLGARISELASSMASMEEECALSLEYATAETRECFDLLGAARDDASDRERLLVQVNELEYEVAALARALDREQYLNEQQESFSEQEAQTPPFFAAEEVHRAEEEHEDVEVAPNETLMAAFWEDVNDEDDDDQRAWLKEDLPLDDDESWRPSAAQPVAVEEKLWGIGQAEEDADDDWYGQDEQLYAEGEEEYELERYKAYLVEQRKLRDEERVRGALAADDDNYSNGDYYGYGDLDGYANDYYGYDSYSDDLPALNAYDDSWEQNVNVANGWGKDAAVKMEREGDWWDDIAVDSEVEYDDDGVGRKVFFAEDDFDDEDYGDFAYDDEEERFGRALEEAEDFDDFAGFFDRDFLEDYEERGREAWELEDAFEDWDRREFFDNFDDTESFNAEIGLVYLGDDDDLYPDDQDLIDFDDDGFDDEDYDKDFVEFLAQQEFEDDDDDAADYDW